MKKAKLLLSLAALAWVSQAAAQPMPAPTPSTPPPVAPTPVPPVAPAPVPPVAPAPAPTTTAATAVLSSDGKVQITVPAGWARETDLNKVANLQYADRKNAQFLMSVTEAKSGFPAGFTIQKHSDITRKQLAGALNSYQEVGPTAVTIGGYPAVQYVLKGKLTAANNLPLTYIHTTIETPNNYHSMVAWTADALYPQSQPVFQQILNSFKEVKP